ncbi:MAG: response regulator [Deltaproteobacteria bacterium]|nr:response regulator [Deltaproteobacteria bacterium]
MQTGTQLRLGLGVILTFVVLLGALAWVKTDLIWLQTKTMYDHPLQVHRVIGALYVDVLQIRIQMRGLPLAESEQEIQEILQQIDIFDADAWQQIDILHKHYLGNPKDIDTIATALVQYKTIRAGNFRLMRAGKTAEVISSLRPNGTAGIQVGKTLEYIKVVDDFARNKGDWLFQAATEQKDGLNRQLTVIVTAILLFSLIISYLLLKGIRDPLRHLTTAAEQFRQGKMDSRSGYVSANEFGVLSAAFNDLADTVETQMHINEQAAQLASVMLRETEARAFCRELLKVLVHHTGSQIGAVYLLNPQKTEFEHFESIGLAAGGRAFFSATEPEGEFGAALATGQIQRITDIPGDTRFTFATVGGDFKPREIITIPILLDHETAAVLSLANIRNYDTGAIRLLEDILGILTARMNGVLAYRQIQELVERLDHQNRELNAQKQELVAQSQELVAQSQELTHQNTELEMQKKQLDEANRLKSTFLSNMSHELRTPLNSVIALSGVLSRRLAGTIPEEEYSYLDVIERNGRHLLSLINDILDISRIEAGREKISLRRFSVRAIAGEIVAMLEPQAREKNIALTNLVGDDLPPIHSDPDKCRHILQNLVGNAVKFTEQGQVTITAASESGTIHNKPSEIHISVTDTGIGIAADQLPRIFEEFRQADDSTSRKYGGTGLGLAIAKKYAALLHGSITVESTPGKGSSFTLRLPLTHSPSCEGMDAETMDGGDSDVNIATGQGKCILLVEDSEPSVIQMTDILTGQGYEVRVARNGHEALAQVEKSLPDAVILDLMMPEMDGFEVLRTIRGTEKSARLPVLILTAKHVTREELSFLTGNHIHQLIQKGDVSRARLLAAVAGMVRPCREEPPAPPSRPHRNSRTVRPGNPIVLVVEDDPDNLRTARALLKERYQVIEAENGRAGLEQARRQLPDIILMDIAMPVMDGVQAIEEIRKDDTLRDIPVIAVTSSAMTGDRETILAHGFDAYISKPIDEVLLQKTLHKVLHGNE